MSRLFFKLLLIFCLNLSVIPIISAQQGYSRYFDAGDRAQREYLAGLVHYQGITYLSSAHIYQDKESVSLAAISQTGDVIWEYEYDFVDAAHGIAMIDDHLYFAGSSNNHLGVKHIVVKVGLDGTVIDTISFTGLPYPDIYDSGGFELGVLGDGLYYAGGARADSSGSTLQLFDISPQLDSIRAITTIPPHASHNGHSDIFSDGKHMLYHVRQLDGERGPTLYFDENFDVFLEARWQEDAYSSDFIVDDLIIDLTIFRGIGLAGNLKWDIWPAFNYDVVRPRPPEVFDLSSSARLYDAQYTGRSSFLLVGQGIRYHGDESTDVGYIGEFDMEGNELWHRFIVDYSEDGKDSRDVGFSMVELGEDGSIYVGGWVVNEQQSWEANGTDIWLMKLDSMGCLSDQPCEEVIRVGLLTGSSEITNEAPGLNIYPNPTSDRMTIACDAWSEIRSVEVYDVTGSLILAQREVSSSEVTLNTSDWKPGVYVVRSHTIDGHYFSNKVIVIQ